MSQSSEHGLAVVTGASSGIGFELARQFAEHEFDLVIAADDEGIVGAADELRDLRVQVEPVQADLTRAEEVERLWDRVRALPPKQRTAVVHRFVGDLAYAEIAEVLGCSEEAARQNVQHGLRALRKEYVR